MLALRDEAKPYPLDLDVRIGKTHAALKGNIDRYDSCNSSGKKTHDRYL